MITLAHEWCDGCIASKFISADDAWKELNRIQSVKGTLSPEFVVDESRDESAPLHRCFEWNDGVAAEKYRVVQAQSIIRNIRVVTKTDGEPQKVRAFIRTETRRYEPIQCVVADAEKRATMLEQCRKDLANWINKYATLNEVAGVIPQLKIIMKELGETGKPGISE